MNQKKYFDSKIIVSGLLDFFNITKRACFFFVKVEEVTRI